MRSLLFMPISSIKKSPTLHPITSAIDIATDLVPYVIDSEDDNVNTAVKVVDGKIWSRREGIMFAV